LNFTPKGAQIRDIYQSRIKNFIAKGQYEKVNLWSMVDLDNESGKEYVKLEVYSVPELKRPPFEEAIQGLFPNFAVVGVDRDLG
jgi:alpha-mannosidase